MQKKKIFSVFFVMALLFLGSASFSYAQNGPKTLTLLYSNNVNGEIDLCPT